VQAVEDSTHAGQKSPRFLGVTRFRYSWGMVDKPSRPVAVILERVAISSPWASHKWQAAGVVPDVGGQARILLERDGLLQKVFPGFEVTLFRDEAEGYYLNVSSGDPSLFISIRFDESTGDAYPFQVSASYSEAARWMDSSEQVERVTVEGEFAAWIGEWVEANYRPEGKRERKRPNSFKGKEGRLREQG